MSDCYQIFLEFREKGRGDGLFPLLLGVFPSWSETMKAMGYIGEAITSIKGKYVLLRRDSSIFKSADLIFRRVDKKVGRFTTMGELRELFDINRDDREVRLYTTNGYSIDLIVGKNGTWYW